MVSDGFRKFVKCKKKSPEAATTGLVLLTGMHSSRFNGLLGMHPKKSFTWTKILHLNPIPKKTPKIWVK